MSRPQPKPKISIPRWVTGEVTMSVAMKKAPRIRPPVTRWNSGFGYLLGSTTQKMPLRTITVPRKLTGVCQLMTFLKIRNRPPRRAGPGPRLRQGSPPCCRGSNGQNHWWRDRGRCPVSMTAVFISPQRGGRGDGIDSPSRAAPERSRWSSAPEMRSAARPGRPKPD